jgi:hypothetical protein
MNLNDFKKSLTGHAPPANSNVYQQSLWYDAKGDWDRAHTLIQDLTDKTAAHLHAYLHRKEGDAWNANYWYQKAGQQMPEYSLDREWEELVQATYLAARL